MEHRHLYKTIINAMMERRYIDYDVPKVESIRLLDTIIKMNVFNIVHPCTIPS